MKPPEIGCQNNEKPWLAADLLPLKPSGSDYGYQIGKKFHPCTREELITACGPTGAKDVELVWHPEAERLVPVLEVSFLHEARRKRLKAGLKLALTGGILGLLVAASAFWKKEPGWEDLFWMNVLFLGVLPLCEWAYGVWQLRTSGAAAGPDALESCRFVLWVNRNRAVYTWIILAVTACVTLAGFVCGLEPSIQRAGLAKAAEFRLEFWRLLTGPLLHGSLPHVMFNLIGIASLGAIAEAMAGRGVMASVIVTATITGSAFSCWWLPDTPSVGISGGVMGLLGFILTLGLRRRSIVPQALPKDLIYGLLTVAFVGLVACDLIDNATHLGGGLAGAGIGLLVTRHSIKVLPLPPSRRWELVGALAISLVIAAGARAVFLIVR